MKKINQVIKQLFTLAGAITLILLLTISFVGCSNNDNKNNVENPGNITDDGATEEPGDENLTEEDNKTTYHTVSFVTAGGSKVDPIQVKHGEKVATPKIPEKEGHTFEGWYYGEEMWSFIGYVVTEDITLLAKWTVNSYYVTVKDSLGRIYGTKEYAYGTELSSGIISTVSCPYGYHIGSVENQDTGCEWDFNKDKVTGDTTIVVIFDKNQYTVSFKVNDTYYGPSQTILHGDTITKPFDPEREGYTFYGWTYNGIRWNFDMDVVTCNMTLEAKFSIYAPDGDKEDLTFKLQYAAGTVLRMATGYNSAQTGISMHPDIAGEGITLADGNTYRVGDLKPTWVELQNVLNVRFEDKYQGKKTAEEFPYWEQQMDQIDMVSGTAADLSKAGMDGRLIDLAEYLDVMPNFKAFLMDNPIVLLSISSVDDEGKVGGIYFAPYFDGVNDIERMPLMRTDWVEKLLNGKGEFSAASSKNIAKAVYTPYMPTSGKVSIDVVKADASGTETITKDYDKAGNIVAKMNAAGEISGVEAVNMLRKYIDEAYNGYYGENRADLFVGQNAAWDADELVALLRCVVANPQTLNGTDSVAGIFSREDNNNQRRIDMFRFAGTLFGVRGLESRQDYLYVGADGLLHDARQEEATYEALERMNALVQEGLIASSFVNSESMKTETMLKNDSGFMHYDYNQTQTVYNQTALQDGEKYMAVMVPVARWFDGTNANGVYMRFTESWRSVKTDGWAISADGVKGNTDKLHAALALIDYAYSEKGQILMSYGPDAFIKTNADGSYVTFDFNGKEMPVISDASYDFLWNNTKSKGNYTDYARQYLGSTLSFVKSQAFEYQCTHEVGREGASKLSYAIKYGTIKHPELAITDNLWYSIVPTVLPNTKAENDKISTFTELASNGKFSQSKGKVNLFVDLIVGGYAKLGVNNRAEFLNKVAKDWKGETYLTLKQDAYDRLIEYWNDLNK